MTATIAIPDTSRFALGGSSADFRGPTAAHYTKATESALRTLRISRLALMVLSALAFSATFAATTIFAPTVVVAVGALLAVSAAIACIAYRTHIAINNRFSRQCAQEATQLYNSWYPVVANAEVIDPLLPNLLYVVQPGEQYPC